jgi:tetratricopeptide (TPR) repeat protein
MVGKLQRTVDNLDHEGHFQESFDLLKEAVPNYTNDAEFAWRWARAWYRLGQESTDKKCRKEHFATCLEHASKALEIDGGSSYGHLWRGICLARMGDFVGPKEKVGNAYVIKDHFEKSFAATPADPISNHTLGAWANTIADISWVERKAASLLFGAPPTATYAEAEAMYLKSYALDPQYVDNTCAMGDLYVSMKRTADARAWLTKCYEIPPKCAKDVRIQKEAKRKAERL